MIAAGGNGPLESHSRRRIDLEQPPEQGNVLRGGVDRVYAPQNAPLFQR